MAIISLILLTFFSIACIMLGVLIYFLPAIIAYRRNHANRVIILILNIVFGWTFLAWAGCLVWAFVDVDGSATDGILKNVGGNNKYDDLEKLHKLKESGAITDVEFEIEKQKILK